MQKYRQVFKYASLGSQLAILLSVAVWAGVKLDQQLAVSPLFLISFPLLAIVVCLYGIIKSLDKDNQKKK